MLDCLQAGRFPVVKLFAGPYRLKGRPPIIRGATLSRRPDLALVSRDTETLHSRGVEASESSTDRASASSGVSRRAHARADTAR